MKIQTKIAKLQVHENLYKSVNENMFSFTFLYKFSWQLKQLLCYSISLLISYMLFNAFKMAVQLF